MKNPNNDPNRPNAVRRYVLACDGEIAPGGDECYLTEAQLKLANAEIEQAQQGCYWIADDETQPCLSIGYSFKLLRRMDYACFCQALQKDPTDIATVLHWKRLQESVVNLLNSIEVTALEKVVVAELKRQRQL